MCCTKKEPTPRNNKPIRYQRFSFHGNRPPPPPTTPYFPLQPSPRFASCNCSALMCTHCFENQLLKSSTKMDFTPVSSFNKMFRCPAENNKNKSSTHCQHVQESFLFYDLLLYFLVYQIWLGNSLSVLLSPS